MFGLKFALYDVTPFLQGNLQFLQCNFALIVWSEYVNFDIKKENHYMGKTAVLKISSVLAHFLRLNNYLIAEVKGLSLSISSFASLHPQNFHRCQQKEHDQQQMFCFVLELLHSEGSDVYWDLQNVVVKWCWSLAYHFSIYLGCCWMCGTFQANSLQKKKSRWNKFAKKP